MDLRASLDGHRPGLSQRAVSGAVYGLSQPAPKPPYLARLDQVRSVSYPAKLVGRAADGPNESKSSVYVLHNSQDAVVASPEPMSAEFEEGQPPTKRANTAAHSSPRSARITEAENNDRAHYKVPGSPLPCLPTISSSSKRPRQQYSRARVDAKAREAHGLEPPAVATHIPGPKKAADFAPWTGHHSEDVLNENVVKSGFSDKVSNTNQAETNSARPTIASSLAQKNSHGLSLLGYLFTSVLEKRQVLGKCTASSAFKPPPRVTVTDTKREAWLRDLANPEVPLRKQSRTIPHGIRGKLLMEQCLSKDVPLQRAVWLAKCVGANELRAFRRKGVSGSAAASGETKWVSEWTEHVEQFLGDVVAACGQQDWQQKIKYAIRLTTAFYAEKLLDTDHYLDWIVSSLLEASLEQLPIWIMFAQLYWKDIIAYGLRGRTLAQAMLEQLHRITQARNETLSFLKQRLQRLIAVLAASNRGCLIIPRTWEQYKYLLSPSTDAATDSTARNIARRNARLTAPMLKTAATLRSPMLRLYDMLDSVDLNLDVQKLSRQGLALIPDVTRLCSALFDWASTRYRTGISRIHLVANILSCIRQAGEDTDLAILRYIDQVEDPSNATIENIHRIIVELVRLQAFSVSRYLQWLIVNGRVTASFGSTCAVSLIMALSADDMPPNVRITRNMLFGRLKKGPSERASLQTCLESISEAIHASAGDIHASCMDLLSSLSLAARFSITQQVCSWINLMAKAGELTLHAFLTARRVVESVQDFASLTLLISSAISSEDSILLATVTDAVNMHAEAFAALQDLLPIANGLKEQYLLLRSQQPLNKTTIHSLMELAKRMPEQTAFGKLLKYDLVLLEQQSSVAVCSPASDSLIGMQAGSLDSEDEIDAVFASGNIMDEPLMHRVFARLIDLASKPSLASLQIPSRLCGWLNQLDAASEDGVFKQMVKEHVELTLSGSGHTISGLDSLVYLIVSDCITFGDIMSAMRNITSSDDALHALPLFLNAAIANIALHETERYRFLLRQDRARDEHGDMLSSLLRSAYEASGIEALFPVLIPFVIEHTAKKPEAIDRLFSQQQALGPLPAAAGRLATLVLRANDTEGSGSDVDLDVAALVNLASPLSIRFCAGLLAYLKQQDASSGAYEDALATAVLDAFAQKSLVWPQLLVYGGERAKKKIRAWALNQLLQAGAASGEHDPAISDADLASCFDLLIVSQCADDDDQTMGRSTITERLKEFDRQLSERGRYDSESQAPFANLLRRLQILLGLCALYVHKASTDDTSANAGRLALLTALCALLVHPRLQAETDTIDHVHDLASTLADNAAMAAQALLQQLSNDKSSLDQRLYNILGHPSTPLDSWLVLASHAQPQRSQQQRALSKHASHQHHPSGSTTSGPAQPSLQLQHQRTSSSGSPGINRQLTGVPAEFKTTPFPLRRWEIMPEVMGENNTSLDLKLFGARKV